MRPPVGIPKLSKRSRILLIIGAVLLAVVVAASRLLGTYVNWLWFGEVGYRSVFNTVLFTQIGLFVVMGLIVAGVLMLNLTIAYRSRPVFVPVSGPDDPVSKYRSVIIQRLRLVGFAVPVVAFIAAGVAAQADWQVVQTFFNGENFGITDPEFNLDIGFYAFGLPFYTWLISWGFVIVAASFVGALVTHYIFGGIRLAGRGGQLSAPARIQLAVLAGLFVLLYAASYFFDRYELLFSGRNPNFYGATYTDLHAVLPAKLILTIIAIFCAVAFFAAAFLRDLKIPAIATVLLVLSSLLVGAAWPALLEQFSVRPNAIQKEAQSIERAIGATRDAYGLTQDKVTFTEYPGRSESTPQEIRSNANNQGTISNVRLLDPNVLARTFTQQQQRKNFYGFGDKLDVDRYRVNGQLRDYIVAVREIDPKNLTENQQNWINRHLVYTHGNGFVAAPANTVNSALQDTSGQGGYPVYTVSDTSGQGDIKVDQPRIYYGELATDYAIVGGKDGGKDREYDTDTASYGYTGKGGVSLGNLFNRLVFSAAYGERNILFSSSIGDESKILYNRDPRSRVKMTAPWLTTDGDPYPAVIDGRIKWIVDGYTTLENYPYAQKTQLSQATQTSQGVRQPAQTFSYIRNSVKATVDAYDGTVNLYAIDEKDPVLKTWMKVFPGTVKPNSEVSMSLREHFRYPEDLFKVQRELLARYHVNKPDVFYSQNEFWDVPDDPTDEQQPTTQQPPQSQQPGAAASQTSGGKLPPYYVIAQAPGQDKPTFQITSALTGLRREFLSAWVSASSDPGDYGKITVLQLPTTTQTMGPGQMQNQFFSASKVTEARTLFQNPQANAVNGNLLTLPVAGGLLYVEPIYIQRKDTNAFPQLARVLVGFGGKVGFSETLAGALEEVFGRGAGEGTTQPNPGATPPPGENPGGTAPPGNQQITPEQAKAIQDIGAAIDRLRKATQNGDFAAIGQAQKDLEDATKRFNQK
ncbi:UPF0182 family protein [Allokutzneria oryzae]|uniref:UPF0182 protein ACFFQA_26160 n=1 Tax=Allokutzneria oryzae TaxID=1378989 RepID=A0ABV6A2P4_9PSEU